MKIQIYYIINDFTKLYREIMQIFVYIDAHNSINCIVVRRFPIL